MAKRITVLDTPKPRLNVTDVPKERIVVVDRQTGPRTTPEIVIYSGYPASGKSTHAQTFIDAGYRRFNRDTMASKLSSLVGMMENAARVGSKQFVLDNTYLTAEQRQPVIEAAKRLKLPVRCLRMGTTFEDAMFNVCQRLVKEYGKIPHPWEFKDLAKTAKEDNIFPAVVMFRARKEFQEPDTIEGITEIATVPFVRKAQDGYGGKAVIFDYDGTLRHTASGNKYPLVATDVVVPPNRPPVLEKYKNDGYTLLGVSNQSGIGTEKVTEDVVVAAFKYTNKLLGHDIDFQYCPHCPPPSTMCYCRKPQPGLGVVLISKYRLDPRQCIFVGDMTTDKTFAGRCGFQYVNEQDFFK